MVARARRDASPAVRLAAQGALRGRDTDERFGASLADAIASDDPVLRRTAREEYRALLLRSRALESLATSYAMPLVSSAFRTRPSRRAHRVWETLALMAATRSPRKARTRVGVHCIFVSPWPSLPPSPDPNE